MSPTLGWLRAMLTVLALAAATGIAAAVAASANPAPAVSVYVQGMSCTSPNACVAVGSTNASSTEPLAWTLQGGAWQLTPTPGVSGSSFLFDVSCAAAGDCIAVGGAEHGPLAMGLSGGVWRRLPVPARDRSATLYGVSCPTEHWCLAAGVGDQEKGMASDLFTGGAWRTVPAPAVKGVSIFALDALSCASRHFCMAVGDATIFGATLHGKLMAFLYNGSAWRAVAVPIAFPRTLPSLEGVSCPRAGECVAVGNSNFYSASPGRQLIIRFRAGRWSPMAARARVGTEPLAISCAAPGACVAVGVQEVGAPVVERLADGRWRMLPAQSPGPPTVLENGATFNDTLQSVACRTTNGCVAVGDYNGSPFSELIGPDKASLLAMPAP